MELIYVVSQASAPNVLDWVNTAGLVGLLLFILWSGVRDKPLWVSGSAFRKMEREKERWERLALRGTDLAEESSKVTKDIIGALEKVLARTEDGEANE